MAVMRDDVDGWKTLLLPYIEERPRPEKVGPIGPLIWELARLSSVLAGIAMDAAEPDPGRKKPTKDEFIRILAMRLKETPLPDDLA